MRGVCAAVASTCIYISTFHFAWPANHLSISVFFPLSLYAYIFLIDVAISEGRERDRSWRNITREEKKVQMLFYFCEKGGTIQKRTAWSTLYELVDEFLKFICLFFPLPSYIARVNSTGMLREHSPPPPLFFKREKVTNKNQVKSLFLILFYGPVPPHHLPSLPPWKNTA